MGGALALAIVLVIGIGGLSLAIQAQKPIDGEVADPAVFPGRMGPANPRVRKPRQAREDRPASPPVVNLQAPDPLPAERPRPPDLLSTGLPAEAKVVNVVDERVVGPVTKARLTLRFTPQGAGEREIQLRHSFSTREQRAGVRVGGTLVVRYDPDDPRRVVIDPGQS